MAGKGGRGCVGDPTCRYQAGGLAAERAGTEAGKAALRIEALGIEVGDNGAATLFAVRANGFDQVVAQVLRAGEIRQLARAQAVGVLCEVWATSSATERSIS